jgi:hypothetical protein
MGVKGVEPADVNRSTEHKGSSAATPGMSALDEEREASLADEGGASGALAESQELRTLRRLASDLPVGHSPSTKVSRRRPGFWLMAGAIAAGALGMLAMRKRR